MQSNQSDSDHDTNVRVPDELHQSFLQVDLGLVEVVEFGGRPQVQVLFVQRDAPQSVPQLLAGPLSRVKLLLASLRKTPDN